MRCGLTGRPCCCNSLNSYQCHSLILLISLWFNVHLHFHAFTGMLRPLQPQWLAAGGPGLPGTRHSRGPLLYVLVCKNVYSYSKYIFYMSKSCIIVSSLYACVCRQVCMYTSMYAQFLVCIGVYTHVYMFTRLYIYVQRTERPILIFER